MHGTTTLERPNRQAIAFEVAREKLEIASAEFDRFNNKQTAAHAAAEAACPREDHWFCRYNLGYGCTREKNVRAAHMSLVIERAKGRHLTAAEAEQTATDANSIVDGFEAYCARHNEAFREYIALQEQFDALVDERERARENVLITTAPDHQSLLFKVELLTTMMKEADVEDAERISAVCADAKRLLGTEA